MFDFGTMALLYLISIPIIGAAVNAINAGVNTIVNRVKAAIPPKGYKTIGPSQAQEKDKRSNNNKTIIGVKTPSDTKSDGLRVMDFASYNDRALCYWYNSSGSSLQAADFGIRGQLVYRLSGMNSMIWEWSNYGDIDINGEKEIRISNNFIVSQAQAEDIGDFARKELTPHNMYQLMVYGCHPYMEIGDIYRLQIDYTMPAGESQIELIDVNVEVRGVRMNRECGQAGGTQLILRVPSGEWTKTTSTRARKILAGLPFDNLNRSNIITVGAYDYTGQADIYCDGTDDDVQIQSAIDILYAAGGGTVQLTRGTYYIANTIAITDKILLVGEGLSSVMKPASNDMAPFIYSHVGEGTIRSFCIDGDSSIITYTSIPLGIIYDDRSPLQKRLVCDSIIVKNFNITLGSGGGSMRMFYGVDSSINCKVSGIETHGDSTIALYCFSNVNSCIACIAELLESDCTDGRLYGFDSCSSVSACSTKSCDISADTGIIVGYVLCANITSSTFVSNTSIGATGNVIGFSSSTSISSCSSNSNTTGANYYGYSSCKNVTVSESKDNTASSNEYGFTSCRSVQQCITNDTVKYNASYADSGTANACADTYQGGFNS